MMAVRSAERFLQSVREGQGFYRVINQMRVLSAEGGKCYCELKISDEHLNCKNTLHGGFTATLVDIVSSIAVATTRKSHGSSTDLNVTYMRPARKGDTLSIVAECLKVGKTMAFVNVDIFNKSEGNKVVAQGRHTLLTDNSATANQDNMRVVSASKGKCYCELEVSDDHVNSKGTLHGGMAATLVDAVSAMAVATTGTAPGFTTDLNITYMRPAKKGDTISIAAECLKVGRTMAFISVDILSKNNGNKMIAQGRQAAKLQ